MNKTSFVLLIMDIKDKAIAELTMPELYKIIQTEVSKGIEHQEKFRSSGKTKAEVLSWCNRLAKKRITLPATEPSTTALIREERDR